MRRLKLLISLVVILGTWLGVYLATGGPRLELTGISLAEPPPPLPEQLELSLLYQNSPWKTSLTCRWTPPVGDTLVSAETIGSGDGVVDFSLAGAAIPRGAHRVDFELGGELILSERFELPPAEALYKTVLSGNFDGLRAETSFRHLTVPLTLRTVWRYAEDDLPGTGEEVVLIEPHGSTVFKLRPLPGKTLPPGDYALLLYVDDAFLAEYEYRIIEESD